MRACRRGSLISQAYILQTPLSTHLQLHPDKSTYYDELHNVYSRNCKQWCLCRRRPVLQTSVVNLTVQTTVIAIVGCIKPYYHKNVIDVTYIKTSWQRCQLLIMTIIYLNCKPHSHWWQHLDHLICLSLCTPWKRGVVKSRYRHVHLMSHRWQVARNIPRKIGKHESNQNKEVQTKRHQCNCLLFTSIMKFGPQYITSAMIK